jgi:hypothetical protein
MAHGMICSYLASGRRPRNMARTSAAVLAALIFSCTADGLAQTIPLDVKSAVAFVFAPKPDGSLAPVGTGFFVAVKHPEKDLLAFYFVTAKHVLQLEGGRGFRPSLHIRINAKAGKTEMLSTRLIFQGPGKNLFLHKDSSVDLAVIPGRPDLAKHEFKVVTDDLITTNTEYQSLQIGEGSEVFFAGLFWQFVGEHRNYPIVRFGRVALVTDERIIWNGIKTDLYLIESGAYGGNSGAPVFFYLGPERVPGSLVVGPRVLKLAGIIQGNFGDAEPIVAIERALVPMARANVGIAAVVPAYKLHEILFSPELKALRKY